jgi:hypothetical protein
MTKFLLNKIVDKSLAGRDLWVDEITDQVQSGSVSAPEIVEIINRLVPLLESEADPTVLESIFNLLGSAFDRIGIQEDALRVIISLLGGLPCGCLVHAIPIIERSNTQGKKELIAPFLKSPNVAVRTIAENSLQS